MSAVAHADPRADINTTPLVDVMLVLLIIFMITAPLLSHRLDAKLPQPGPDQDQPAPVQLALLREAGLTRLYWDGELVDERALVARLRDAGTAEQTPLLVVRAADQVGYTELTDLLATLRAAGLSSVTVDPQH